MVRSIEIELLNGDYGCSYLFACCLFESDLLSGQVLAGQFGLRIQTIEGLGFVFVQLLSDRFHSLSRVKDSAFSIHQQFLMDKEKVQY